MTTTTSPRAAVFVGRALAGCLHPCAAWRSFPKHERVGIAAGYFAVAYVSVLVLLAFTHV